jgi:hypothetical protein
VREKVGEILARDTLLRRANAGSGQFVSESRTFRFPQFSRTNAFQGEYPAGFATINRKSFKPLLGVYWPIFSSSLFLTSDLFRMCKFPGRLIGNFGKCVEFQAIKRRVLREVSMLRQLLLIVLALFGTSRVFAQLLPDRLDNGLTHVHSAPAAGQLPTGMIDGSQHPEQIADSTAYRLFLLTVSESSSPTAERKSRQLAFLKLAGLDDNDVQAAIPVLAKFKAQYTDLIKQYNQSVDEANKNGTSPDIKTFLSQRDALVQSTRDALSQAVSANGMLNVHAHLQRQKSRMKVPAQEGQ